MVRRFIILVVAVALTLILSAHVEATKRHLVGKVTGSKEGLALAATPRCGLPNKPPCPTPTPTPTPTATPTVTPTATPAPSATPLFNGDTFTVQQQANFPQGGEGPLPPYQWSSGWTPEAGFVKHSNSDPSVLGATVVPDPGGLFRQVVKLNADEQNIGCYSSTNCFTRMEVRGPEIFGPGMDRWIIAEMWIPTDQPTMPAASSGSDPWWSIVPNVYGAPYGGSSYANMQISRNLAGTGNDIVLRRRTGARIWRVPATEGVWHILAIHEYFSTDATQGFREIWYSQRDATGNPTGPLTRQTFSDGTQRLYYATLESGVNWDGSTRNFPELKNYHTARMFGTRRYTPLYFARHRVYDAATVPVTQIDPFYTGLK